MKTLSINADKEEIKNLVIEWIELLAQEKYSEALEYTVDRIFPKFVDL